MIEILSSTPPQLLFLACFYNYRNELNENAIPSGMYPNMIDNFFYKRCTIQDTKSQDVVQLSPDLFIGSARCTTK